MMFWFDVLAMRCVWSIRSYPWIFHKEISRSPQILLLIAGIYKRIVRRLYAIFISSQLRTNHWVTPRVCENTLPKTYIKVIFNKLARPPVWHNWHYCCRHQSRCVHIKPSKAKSLREHSFVCQTRRNRSVRGVWRQRHAQSAHRNNEDQLRRIFWGQSLQCCANAQQPHRTEIISQSPSLYNINNQMWVNWHGDSVGSVGQFEITSD